MTTCGIPIFNGLYIWMFDVVWLSFLSYYSTDFLYRLRHHLYFSHFKYLHDHKHIASAGENYVV